LIGTALKKRWHINKRKPGRIRGASTISQQVAKNVFLWQGKGWIRKGLEVYFTFMIELVWARKRILEMYLNVIEMGNGIFGAEMAAQKYFNKPQRINKTGSSDDCSLVYSNPKRWKVKPLSNYVAARSGWVMQQMRHWNLIRTCRE